MGVPCSTSCSVPSSLGDLYLSKRSGFNMQSKASSLSFMGHYSVREDGKGAYFNCNVMFR